MQLDIDPSSLSDVEFHIYSYILSNIKRVTYMSIQELARETNSSTASILRFCSRANCNGYAEFKFRLRAELDSQLDRNDQPLADSLPEIRSFFETTVPSKDFNTGIQNAAELLIRKSIVIFAGLGSSDYASGYGASRGLGRAIALSLARAGADVIITYEKSADKAQAVADEIRRWGATAKPCRPTAPARRRFRMPSPMRRVLLAGWTFWSTTPGSRAAARWSP